MPEFGFSCQGNVGETEKACSSPAQDTTSGPGNDKEFARAHVVQWEMKPRRVLSIVDVFLMNQELF